MRRVSLLAALQRSAFERGVSEPAMSHQGMEMQFADPDWQPASSRPGRSPGEQALAVPVEIKHALAPSPQASEEPAMRLWTPGPGQTPPWPIQSSSADSI